MTIIGIGIDIVEINRIKKQVLKNGDKFANRILTINELKQYNKKNKSIRFLATRFAIKEASLKALGIGIRNGISLSNIEVYNNTFGKPFLYLYSKAKKLAELLGVLNIVISLTDEKKYACAIVIFEN